MPLDAKKSQHVPLGQLQSQYFSTKKHLIKSFRIPFTACSILNLFYIHLAAALPGNHSGFFLSSHPHTFNPAPSFVHSPYPLEADWSFHNQSNSYPSTSAYLLINKPLEAFSFPLCDFLPPFSAFFIPVTFVYFPLFPQLAFIGVLF